MNESEINIDEYYQNQKERLYYLRELVVLNPIDKLRVLHARSLSEKYRNFYNMYNPNDIIETDYSVADDLEYTLRYKTFVKKLEKDFISYLNLEKDGYGLEEHAESVLNNYIESRKEIKSGIKR